jgi:hypothetical protein
MTYGDVHLVSLFPYVRNDPVNKIDPNGKWWECAAWGESECSDWVLEPTDLRDMGGGGRKTEPFRSKYPNCNPGNIAVREARLDFIAKNYSAALTVANQVIADLATRPGSIAVSAASLTTAFLEWSANESNFGKDPQLVAKNNYFGFQNPTQKAGAYGGAYVACDMNNPLIPANTKNACIASSYTWGMELNLALSIPSSGTGKTYLSALETALKNNPTDMAGAIQAIADNGWNGPGYGKKVTNGQWNLNNDVTCMKDNGYIP